MKKSIFISILIPFLLFYAIPAGAVEKEENNWQDETIYYLMVDRFNNMDVSNDFDADVKDSMSYQGGDFKGIIDKLDYLKDMGFTAIALSPVFDNEEKGYHGYWVKDFYKTDEHFGSMQKFKELVKEAHERDMKIILDFVIGHVGPNHEWVSDSEKTGWFIQKQLDSRNRHNHEGKTLPSLNQKNPEVQRYLINAAKWWIEETDIDGYRFEATSHTPNSFLNKFSQEMKAVKNDFYLLGDVSMEDIPRFEKTGIDGFMDYNLNKQLRIAFEKADQSMKGPFNAWNQSKKDYENSYLMGTFMDDAFMPRFTREVVKNKVHPGPRWKMALTYLYTTPGIPIVFYGSEIAVDGGESPDNRRLMDFRTDKELIDYITKLAELRNEYPALTLGSMELLYEEKGMAVYKRVYKDETAVIAINNTSKSQQVSLKESDLIAGKELRGLLAGDLVRSKNGKYDLIIDREKAEVYFLAEKTGLNIPYLVIMGSVYAALFVFLILVWKRSKKKTKK